MEYTIEELEEQVRLQQMRIENEEDMLEYYKTKLKEMKENELTSTFNKTT